MSNDSLHLGGRSAAAVALLWVLAPLTYLVGEAVAASAFANYSYASNYISDLGVADVGFFQGRHISSPLHAVMNLSLFAQGILFLVAAIIVFRSTRSGPRKTFLVLSVLYAAGITLVTTVSGSQAHLENGLIVFHVSGALLAILGGNVAVIVAGIGSRRIGASIGYSVISVGMGVAGIAAIAGLLAFAPSQTDGVWERASVYSILAWELMTAAWLSIANRRSGSSLTGSTLPAAKAR